MKNNGKYSEASESKKPADLTIQDIIETTLRATTFRIKKTVYVPQKLGRDPFGRFNGKNRKEYSYCVLDYTKPVSRIQLMAENIEMNNSILNVLKSGIKS